MVVYYVSGHGFGHATRSRAVMDAFRELEPSMGIHVRTAAPASIFAPDVHVSEVRIDPQVIESADALSVNGPASLRALDDYLKRLDSIVAAEAHFVKQCGARLIVADIPFAAGLIARKTGLPAIAVGNFTWDWIWESAQASSEALGTIRRGYEAFDLALRLPLCQPDHWSVFPRVRDVGLLTPRSNRPREEVLKELRLTKEGRAFVLVGGRARLSAEVRERIEQENPDFCFLSHDALPSYHDLVRASDMVVSKIGYSIAAECIAEGKAILFPPRAGFREDQVLATAVPEFVPSLEIPTGDWSQGNWRPYLRALIAKPKPARQVEATGARDCARVLQNFL